MTVDRLLALLVIPLAAPFAALIAIAVYLDSPGPVVYRARRVGRHGREFDMLKFRTMINGAAGPAISAHGDARYTPLGRFLSRSRMDELPQLWNVLRGDMRFVGPRPEARRFVDAFPREYAEILEVPPGVTGPAQVDYAWEGEVLAAAEEHDRERLYRDTILPMKVLLDLKYVRGEGRRDLAVLARTVLLPVRQLGLVVFRHGRTAPRPVEIAALIATAGLISLMLVDGAQAQEPGVTIVAPSAGSPAGDQYAVPTESGREEASPAPPARARNSEDRAPITTDQGYGSSATVPGTATRAGRPRRGVRRAPRPAKVRATGKIEREARDIAPAAVPVRTAGGPSPERAWVLIILAVGAGLGAAAASRRATGDA